MSGSNTICTTTVLLETGMVEMREPETVVRLEAPGGVVEATRGLPGRALRVGRVHERAVLRRSARRAARGRRPRHDLGRRRLRRHVVRDRRRPCARLRDRAARGRVISSLAGERIREAAREQLPCVHPENPEIAGISIVQIAEPWQGVGKVTRNAVVVAPGRLDRSATGTGLSARLAVLHARGQMQVGDAMSHASAIGSTFDGRIVRETQVGSRPGSSPRSAEAHGSRASRRSSSTTPTPIPRATCSPTRGASAGSTRSKKLFQNDPASLGAPGSSCGLGSVLVPRVDPSPPATRIPLETGRLSGFGSVSGPGASQERRLRPACAASQPTPLLAPHTPASRR